MKQSLPFYMRLQYERERRGWSQEYLAERVGSDPKTVGRWEGGLTLPQTRYRRKLVELFGIEANEFGLPTRYTSNQEQIQASSTAIESSSEGNIQGIQGGIVVEDLVEAPALGHFYGRVQELSELDQWISHDRCRIVTVTGSGGVGKTIFAAKVVEQAKNEFEYIFWRSLQNVPSLPHILKECLQFLSDQPHGKVPENTHDQIQALMRCLREHRCLLILDNFESVFQPGKRAGSYQIGYEDYGTLLLRAGTVEHRSCLLVTGREKPKEIARLEGKSASVRTLLLPGVEQVEGRAILKDKGLSGSDEQWRELIIRYAGNPLALKLIAESIQMLFNGDIGHFLEQAQMTFGEMSELLDQQFQRLSLLEREILIWLAIEREAVMLEDLHMDLVRPVLRGELFEALLSLHRRSLIESSGSARFTLQPIIMDYVTNYLTKRACKEFGAEQSPTWIHFAFIKAKIKDYVRDSQRRLILVPVAERLLHMFGKEHVAQNVRKMFSAQRHLQAQQRGYLVANGLHLLLHLQYDLRGFDVSHIAVRQAYLQGVRLPEVNFTDTYFMDTIFSDTLSNILSVSFSPDGQLLAAGTATGEIWVYQAQTGTPLFTCHGHTDGVWSLAFSPEGSILISGSDDQTVRVWDVTSHDCLMLLNKHTNRVRAVAFHPDGKVFVSGSDDQSIRVWEANSGACLALLSGHIGRVWSLAFSPNGDQLASGSTDKSIRLWDVPSGACTRILAGHRHNVRSVVFHPEGRLLASGGDDRTVRLWESDSGKCLGIFQLHTNHVWSVAFGPDGRMLASASEDQTICLWDIQQARRVRTLHEHTHGVRAVAFSPDGGIIASGGDDQSLRLWEVMTGRCLTTLQGHSNRVWSVAFSKDAQKFASGSEDQHIRVWNVQTDESTELFCEPTHGVRCVAYSPIRDILASCGEDQTVCLWEISTSLCLKVLRGHENWLRYVTFSPDGERLASCGEDMTIRIWMVKTGGCLQLLKGHTHWIRTVSFSPDGQLLASGSDDQTIRLWAVNTGQCLRVLEGHTNRVRAVTFSPNGRILASGSEDCFIYLWNIESGHRMKTFQGHTDWVMAIAFSPEGDLLISGSVDQTIRVWEVKSAQCLAVLKGHESRVRSVVFSPDGMLILSGGDDGAIKLWDRQTLQCIKTFVGERPYERMNISEAQGLTDAQKTALRRLGAIERAKAIQE